MNKAIYAGVTQPSFTVEDGIYQARLFQIIQIGSHRFEKDGREWYSPQILLGFELPQLAYENMDGVKVAQIKSGTYFLSMNPSRKGVVGLREVIDGMRGSDEYTEDELEQFDISKFLGKLCHLKIEGVESKGQVYQNITEVHPFDPKNDKLQAEEGVEFRKEILVTVEDFKDVDILGLPAWIADKIRASQEYQKIENRPENEQKFMDSLDKADGQPKKDSDEGEVKIEDLDLD